MITMSAVSDFPSVVDVYFQYLDQKNIQNTIL